MFGMRRKKVKSSFMGRHFLSACLSLLIGALVVLPSTPARAGCPTPYPCSTVESAPWWESTDFNTLQKTWLENDWFQNQIINDLYSNKILRDWWENQIRPELQKMAGQIISANVDMTGAVGGFMDGQQINRSQLLINTLHAQAIKDYTPGETLCRFGTGVRSLAAAQERQNLNYVALSEMSQARQLGTRGGSADAGPVMDRKARIDQFKRVYCDPADNNGDLRAICTDGANPISTPRRFNKDINYTRTLETQRTLDLDFTNGQTTADEEDVLALANNLYGHDVFQRLTDLVFSGKGGNEVNKLRYLDLRQIVAMRNVAENSYNAIAAMRGRGATGSSDYLRHALMEMGMSDAEAQRYLAGSTSGNGASEPSYFAQMEVLTKKLYQNPNFYVNLIDKPANVDRTQAAMQAFGLMQDRDVYQSLQRQEMLLSMLLEIRVRREQADVTRRLKILGMAKK